LYTRAPSPSFVEKNTRIMKTQLKNGLILGMIFLSANVFAQTTEVVETSEGKKKSPTTHLRLLLNIVNTNLDYGQSGSELWSHKSSNRGLQAGASFQAGITSRISVLSEFYYMRKGGQINAANSQTGSKATLRFHALEVPVLARFHFGKFHVNAGPSLAYNLSGRMKTEGTSSSLSFNRSSDGYRRLDAGVQFGGGYQFKIKQKTLVLDIRYSRGLTNLSRSQEIYNRYLNVSLQVINPWKVNPLARK
jgi:hypothetical protein